MSHCVNVKVSKIYLTSKLLVFESLWNGRKSADTLEGRMFHSAGASMEKACFLAIFRERD